MPKGHPMYPSEKDTVLTFVVYAPEEAFRVAFHPLFDEDEEGDVFWFANCLPTEPMEMLDAREVVHDAIERYEAVVGPLALEEGVHLSFQQRHPCVQEGGFPFGNEVGIHTEGGTFSAFYDDEGSFLLATGP